MIAQSWIFPYSEIQRERFITGELWQVWAEQYPDIFDTDDLRIVRNQACLGYHYYEWLAAILIFRATGYLSLVEKYGFKNHKRKMEILQTLVSPDIMGMIVTQPAKAQNPDLLVYSPSSRFWFFCEVKGTNDYVRAVQEEYFAELEKATNRPVYIAMFESV